MNDYPINAKFCRIMQNHVLTQVIWPKYQISKIQDGGRPPFWKWFYRYISAASSDLNAILCAATNYASKDGHMTKCHNFANSTWRMAAIMKIVFSAIKIIWRKWLTRNFVQRSRITQTQLMWPKYSGSRHLNRDNKTANINVKTVVYL